MKLIHETSSTIVIKTDNVKVSATLLGVENALYVQFSCAFAYQFACLSYIDRQEFTAENLQTFLETGVFMTQNKYNLITCRHPDTITYLLQYHRPMKIENPFHSRNISSDYLNRYYAVFTITDEVGMASFPFFEIFKFMQDYKLKNTP